MRRNFYSINCGAPRRAVRPQRDRITLGELAEGLLATAAFGALMAMAIVGGLLFEEEFVQAGRWIFGN